MSSMKGSSFKTRMKVEMPGIQTRYTGEEERAMLKAVRELNSFTQGPELKNFEKEFAEYIGVPAAVGVCNGTAALELAAVLSNVGPEDEIIIPAHTFVASAVPFARRGARLVFADIDPQTRVISSETIQSCLTQKTKVVVVVHLYGLMADMDPIMALSDKHGFRVVEDCAQSPGAIYRGKRAGSIGDFGCFSFHTNKNITTLGEGGLLVCRDPKAAERARKLSWLGNWPFEGERERYWLPAMSNLVVAVEGVWPYNFCLSEIQAAVGRVLLRKLDAINEQRRKQAESFRKGLADDPELSFQRVAARENHVYHLMSAVYDGGQSGKNRDDLIELLWKEYQIKCIIQYWPLYRSELFKSFGYGENRCPNAEFFFDHMISFPWWSNMPSETIQYMIESVKEAIHRLRTSV